MDVFCTNCGQKIQVENTLVKSFCPFCGNELVISEFREEREEHTYQDSIIKLTKEIETLFDQQSYEECIETCEEIILSNPRPANALLYKAMCLMKLSSLGDNYSEEAVQLAVRARKCSNNPKKRLRLVFVEL